MACYLVPAAGAILLYLWRKKIKSKKVETFWLNLLFAGGAIFGVIDHFWNGELFLISENIVSDLLLGIVITLGIIASWGIIVLASKFVESKQKIEQKFAYK